MLEVKIVRIFSHELLVSISIIKNNLSKMIIENLYLIFKITFLMTIVDYQLRLFSCG